MDTRDKDALRVASIPEADFGAAVEALLAMLFGEALARDCFAEALARALRAMREAAA